MCASQSRPAGHWTLSFCCAPSDADDFDVEQGFAGDEEKDQWKGEDEELDMAVRDWTDGGRGGGRGKEGNWIKGLKEKGLQVGVFFLLICR